MALFTIVAGHPASPTIEGWGPPMCSIESGTPYPLPLQAYLKGKLRVRALLFYAPTIKSERSLLGILTKVR